MPFIAHAVASHYIGKPLKETHASATAFLPIVVLATIGNWYSVTLEIVDNLHNLIWNQPKLYFIKIYMVEVCWFVLEYESCSYG